MGNLWFGERVEGFAGIRGFEFGTERVERWSVELGFWIFAEHVPGGAVSKFG